MTEDRKPRRRRRWIIPLVAVGAGAWYLRSRRPAPDPWHPALPEPARAEPQAHRDPAPVDPVRPRHAAATPDAATLDVPASTEPRHSAAPDRAPGFPATTPLAGPPRAEPVAPEPVPVVSEPVEPVEPEPVEPEPVEPEPVEPEPVEPEPVAPEPSPDEAPAGTATAEEPEPPVVSTSGALTGGTPNALFTPTAPTPGQGVQPLPDGSSPSPEYTIKGNAGSMLFHPPSSPYYKRTKAEVWFRTAEDATAAGYTEWVPKKRTP